MPDNEKLMGGATIKKCNVLPCEREKHAVHWFRKGLRLHDNPALRAGLQNASTFRCVFVLDPYFAGSSNVGVNKWRFLLECLEDLDRSLRNLNSRLFVIRGQPADALPKVFREWKTTCLTFEEDPEPFGRIRDQNITAICKDINIDVITAVSHTLYNLDDIIEKSGGEAPISYYEFQAIIAAMPMPPKAEPTITLQFIDKAITPIHSDHEHKYGVPTLSELNYELDGLQGSTVVWIGGETEALARVNIHLDRKAYVASFGKPKMSSESLLASRTCLSPYFRFGCLSTRLFYHRLNELYIAIKNSAPPLSLHGQILWREFFYCAATKNLNFDKIDGNPICIKVRWDNDPESLLKWANGTTGFPWIDAIMTQLREEGWIHLLARHAVACFLTRGDLWISWEEGMKVFEELMLDADWSVNAGTWMWLSCSSFFQTSFHCYSPVKFGKKADPRGDYIKRYIPALKDFPVQYVHEPWKAPLSLQKKYDCIIGTNYPTPIVNHDEVSRINMERIRQAYQKFPLFLNLTAQKSKNYGKEDDKKYSNNEDLNSQIMYDATKASLQNMCVNFVSSPSPNTVLRNVNHSEHTINTTPEIIFNHDEIPGSSKKPSPNYCNDQQEKGNSINFNNLTYQHQNQHNKYQQQQIQNSLNLVINKINYNNRYDQNQDYKLDCNTPAVQCNNYPITLSSIKLENPTDKNQFFEERHQQQEKQDDYMRIPEQQINDKNNHNIGSNVHCNKNEK